MRWVELSRPQHGKSQSAPAARVWRCTRPWHTLLSWPLFFFLCSLSLSLSLSSRDCFSVSSTNTEKKWAEGQGWRVDTFTGGRRSWKIIKYLGVIIGTALRGSTALNVLSQQTRPCFWKSHCSDDSFEKKTKKNNNDNLIQRLKEPITRRQNCSESVSLTSRPLQRCSCKQLLGLLWAQRTGGGGRLGGGTVRGTQRARAEKLLRNVANSLLNWNIGYFYPTGRPCEPGLREQVVGAKRRKPFEMQKLTCSLVDLDSRGQSKYDDIYLFPAVYRNEPAPPACRRRAPTNSSALQTHFRNKGNSDTLRIDSHVDKKGRTVERGGGGGSVHREVKRLES